MRKADSFGIRLHASVLDQLEAEAVRRGVTRAALVRALVEVELEELRSEDRRRLRALLDKVHEQARAVFEELSAGEIEEGDQIEVVFWRRDEPLERRIVDGQDIHEAGQD